MSVFNSFLYYAVNEEVKILLFSKTVIKTSLEDFIIRFFMFVQIYDHFLKLKNEFFSHENFFHLFNEL